ncbi:unnamed protein product [Effrenium voratum]|uniref:Uncharacterized protein n=1 Tax=Effrenium voratum TaxID=2562239 RepID=A0AA36MJA9_9DINO|nr:unnamed protein product [Effrenium voratum]CAJ1370380.1 unnamed protein product [Effrenium voratum]CAJ1420501.1 unnamed protein product [Effrenium voratum]
MGCKAGKVEEVSGKEDTAVIQLDGHEAAVMQESNMSTDVNDMYLEEFEQVPEEDLVIRPTQDGGPVLLGNTPVATMAETVIRVKDASSVAAAEMRRGYCQCCADCS